MIDAEIDNILQQEAAAVPFAVDPALLHRIAKSIQPNLSPVRPLAPAWLRTIGLAIVSVAIALLGAKRLGFYGIRALSSFDRALVFSLLAILIGLTASSAVSQMTPGSRRRFAPGLLLSAGTLALLAVFAFLFRDYRTEDFVHLGMSCLATGLLYALPAAIGIWFLLRRGFAVNPTAAGTVAGTLAGLAGVAMLELHCPNFEAFHVMLWHASVVLISAALGALLGLIIKR